MNQNSYIPEMMLALQANIEYLRQEGDSQMRIRNGRLAQSFEGGFIYDFDLDIFQNIEPDSEVEVRVGGARSSGKVVAITERHIQIELEKSIGSAIPEALLVISSYYLLQLLNDKLASVQSGEIKLTGFEEKVFGLVNSKTSLSNYIAPFSKTVPPNKYQQDAIALALGSEVSFIWGPPGTGKTQTIARVVEGFIAQNKSVLLISHTNVATDGALLATVKHLSQTQDYQDGRFIREGDISKPELKEKYPLVIVERVIEKKSEPLHKALTQLLEKRNKADTELEIWATQYRKAILLDDLGKRLTNLRGYIAQQDAVIQEQNKNITKLEEDEEKTEALIQKYHSTGALKRVLTGANLDKLTRGKSQILLALQSAIDSKQVATKEATESKGKIVEWEDEVLKLDKELQGFDIAQATQQKDRLEKEISNIDKERNSIQKQIEEMAVEVLKEAKLVATTLTKSYSSKIVLSREYDCVILDEASMAPLPAVWFATGLAKHQAVIVGDFLQLPPIAKYKVLHSKDKSVEVMRQQEQAVNKWLKRDIFSVAGISQAIDEGREPVNLRQLKIQYRMHPDIGDVVNELVYKVKGDRFALIHDESTKKNGKDLLTKEPLKKSHLGVYDTSSLGTVATRVDSGSYYNLFQALLSVDLARQAIENGYEDVGIISPFRAQTNLIQKMIKDLNIGNAVEADTVHRFQGGEKQIVIFDITTPIPTKLTDDQAEKGDDEKLINVAFSRAKEKCIVIGDVDRILKRHSQSSLLRKYIEYCRQHKSPFVAAENILAHYQATQTAEKWMKKIYNVDNLQKDIEQSSLFDEKDFYPRFVKDMLVAEKELIIVSPFITKHRTEFFLQLFQLLLDKGVKIFVVTRPAEEHDEIIRTQALSAMKQFEEIGVTVLPIRKMIHQKLAVVDRSILWEGSLNILSQRSSQEIMRRFEGVDTAKQMMTFLKIDKNIGEMGTNQLQRCPSCEGPGAWYWTDKSMYGLWTFCLVGGHSVGKLPKTEEEKKAGKDNLIKLRKAKKKLSDDGVPICPSHDLPMVLRKSRYGEFWGCQKYPKCRVVEKVKVLIQKQR